MLTSPVHRSSPVNATFPVNLAAAVRRRTLLRVVLVLTVVLCLLSLLPVPDSAQAAGPAKPYDFNGDGYADLATGVPGDRVGRKDGAGAVNVLYGSAKGLTTKRAQLWSQGSPGVKGRPSSDESFGQVVTSGDFDCDGRADLAVATQTKVAVLYGSGRGLTARDQLISAGLGISGGSGRLVEQLTSGDFDRDGCHELAAAGEGVLAVIRGSERGLRTPRRLTLPAAVAAAGSWYDGLTAGDLTGDGIADLVVGGADSPTRPGESARIVMIPGSASGLQPGRARAYGPPPSPVPSDRGFFSHLYGASLAIGDFNGDRAPDLAIGDPGAGLEEYTNEVEDLLLCPGYDFCSGAVVVLLGTRQGLSSTGPLVWTEATLGREYQSGLGRALAAGDVNADGRDDLAVHEHWSVSVFAGTRTGLSAAGRRQWTWGSAGVKGRDADDLYGGAFGCGVVRLLDHGRGRAADLSVGSQHYQESVGAVNVLYGSDRGITAGGDQLWQQSSRGVPGAARDGDHFGADRTCYIDEG